MAKIRYLSLIRDLTGVDGEELDVKKETKVSEFIGLLRKKYPKLDEWIESGETVIVLVDGSPKGEEDVIGEANEIAVIPPVSGGGVKYIGEPNPAEIIEKIKATAKGDVGAIALFLGIVKGEVDGKSVKRLEYITYEPYSSKSIEQIAGDIRRKHGIAGIEIIHAAGARYPGDYTIAIAISARSRREAIKALSEAIEKIKEEALIWKLEVREDGEYWILGDGRRVPRKIFEATSNNR